MLPRNEIHIKLGVNKKERNAKKPKISFIFSPCLSLSLSRLTYLFLVSSAESVAQSQREQV